jgi:hypothetical protein
LVDAHRQREPARAGPWDVASADAQEALNGFAGRKYARENTPRFGFDSFPRRGVTSSKLRRSTMIQMTNKYGQIDLSVIDPVEVAKLSDEQQAILALVVEAVQNREAAHVRLKKAEEDVHEAMRIETDAIAADQAANPPMTALEAHRASIASFNATYNK